MAELGSPRQFDLIAFDWDGTLFDSTAIITRCIQAAVVDVGGARPSDEQAAYVIGLGLLQALAHAAPDVPAHKYPELGARYRHHYMAHQNDISLFEGVVTMLGALKSRRHLLAVATGKGRRGLDEALQAAQLRGVFDGSRTADETMIGDTTHDLQMALNAGCASVAVSYGAHEPAAFEVLRPRYVAHSVEALHQWLLANA